MAIGDQATAISINGTISGSVTFTCPQDLVINTTPVITKPITLNNTILIYGSVNCTGCGKRLFITVNSETISVTVQQVQA